MFKVDEIYTRKSIGEILNTNTRAGNWISGYTTFKDELFIFATIKGEHYYNRFLDNTNILEWFGKNNTTIHQPLVQRIINNEIKMHLFIRYEVTPKFIYKGVVRCISFFDETPVRFHLKLL